MNAVTNRVPENAGNFQASWGTLAFTEELCSLEVVDGLVGLLAGRLFIYLLGQLLS